MISDMRTMQKKREIFFNIKNKGNKTETGFIEYCEQNKNSEWIWEEYFMK